jgi:hypothetical protein
MGLISWETLPVLRQSGWQQPWEIVRCRSEKTSLFGVNALAAQEGLAVRSRSVI